MCVGVGLLLLLLLFSPIVARENSEVSELGFASLECLIVAIAIIF